MSLDLSQFAGLNRNGPAAQAQGNATGTGNRPNRKNAKFWINPGYPKTITNDAGEEETIWVSLGLGVPLDQIEEYDLDRVKTTGMATLRSRQNKLRAKLLARAEKLEPGQSVIISFDPATKLGMELRRVAEAATPIEDEDEDDDFNLPD